MLTISSCWHWAHAAKDGYGVIWKNNKRFYAHRVTYESFVGPIPAGMVIDHLCRVTICVNPDHLEVVTASENTRRGNVGLFHSRKTHCPQGHIYNQENTYSYKGTRHCRECRAIHYQSWKEKHR